MRRFVFTLVLFLVALAPFRPVLHSDSPSLGPFLAHLEGLVAKSDMIIVGRVSAVKYTEKALASGSGAATVTLEDYRVIKGPLTRADTRTYTFSSGQLWGIGEDVILFFRSRKSPEIVERGALRIPNERRTEARVLLPYKNGAWKEVPLRVIRDLVPLLL